VTLQKQNVPVIFSGGIETKTDRKQVIAGSMLQLTNGWYQSPGEIRKRYGYKLLSSSIYNSLNLPTPISITSGSHVAGFHSQNQLVVLDGKGTFSYSKDKDKLIGWNRNSTAYTTGADGYGAVIPTNIQRQNITRAISQESIQSPDVAYCPTSNLYCYAYVYSYLGSYKYVGWTIVDSQNNIIIQKSLGSISPYGGVQVRLIGNNFFIFFSDLQGPYLSYIKFSAISPDTTYSTSTITISQKGYAYDVVTIGTTAYVVYSTANGTGGSNIAVKTIDSSGTISAETVLLVGPAETSICAFTEGTNLWIAWGYLSGTSTAFKAAVYNTSLTQILAPTSLGALATGITNRNITALVVPSTTTACILFDSEASPAYLRKTYSVSLTLAGAVGTRTMQMRNVSLQSKVFYENGNIYAITGYQSQAINSNYLLQIKNFGAGNSALANMATVVSTICQGYAGNINCLNATYGAQVLPSILNVPNPKLLTQNAWIYPGLEIDTLTLNPAFTYSNISTNQITGLGCEIIDFHKSVQSQEIANGLHVNVGKLQYFDGNVSVEHGFHVPPEISTTSIATGAVATNKIGAGTYSYTAVFSWVDNNGITHRSAISGPSSVTTTATGASGSTVTVSVSTLHLTQKINIHVELYRTTNGGTVSYLVNSQNIINSNGQDDAFDTVDIVDNVPDSVLTGYFQLYTTGGKVINSPCPPPLCSAIFNNRLFVVPSDNPLTYWYSQQIATSQSPVEFSNLLTGQIDSLGGEITGLSTLDDKLIVFKRNAIFVLTGQGPDPAGLNNYFSPPQYISVDIGAISQASIVSTSLGIMFKSDKGICLLDRSLSIAYIGAAVEAYNNYDVYNATLYPNYNHVRFLLSNGTALIYDYFIQKWSLYDNHPGISATVFQNTYTYLTAIGGIYEETPEVYSDAGSYIQLSMVTSWFNFAPIQGFTRIYKLMLLGEYLSPHALTVQIAYDFDPTIKQTSNITPIGPYQAEYRVFLARQKCTSMQFTLSDSSTGTIGEGYSISAMSFEVGLKRGLNKLPASQSVG
jgi:hypothetical protein